MDIVVYPIPDIPLVPAGRGTEWIYVAHRQIVTTYSTDMMMHLELHPYLVSYLLLVHALPLTETWHRGPDLKKTSDNSCRFIPDLSDVRVVFDTNKGLACL